VIYGLCSINLHISTVYKDIDIVKDVSERSHLGILKHNLDLGTEVKVMIKYVHRYVTK
jgi:hypothetical protein